MGSDGASSTFHDDPTHWRRWRSPARYRPSDRPALATAACYPLAISTVALSLTGIGTVLTEAVTGVNITQAPLTYLITALVAGAACLTIYGVLLRLIGGCALGRQGAVRDMGLGALLGAVFVSLPMLVLLAGGWWKVSAVRLPYAAIGGSPLARCCVRHTRGTAGYGSQSAFTPDGTPCSPLSEAEMSPGQATRPVSSAERSPARRGSPVAPPASKALSSPARSVSSRRACCWPTVGASPRARAPGADAVDGKHNDSEPNADIRHPLGTHNAFANEGCNAGDQNRLYVTQ